MEGVKSLIFKLYLQFLGSRWGVGEEIQKVFLKINNCLPHLYIETEERARSFKLRPRVRLSAGALGGRRGAEAKALAAAREGRKRGRGRDEENWRLYFPLGTGYNRIGARRGQRLERKRGAGVAEKLSGGRSLHPPCCHCSYEMEFGEAL